MRPPRHRARWWRVARGVHRRVVTSLAAAVTLGVGIGWMSHSATLGTPALLCGALALLVAVWPLTWLATLRIARPMMDLARVASELQGGRLRSRGDLLTTDDAEVGQVASALKAMADRVAGQLDDQRALLAAVSHELRSPLGRLRVLVELDREGRSPETLHDDLQAEIEGMDALVGDLLAGARIDFEAIHPTELQPDAVARTALQLADLPTDLLVIHGQPAPVKADATLLARALAGLLENARRYGGAPVALGIHDEGDRVRFEVLDDGAGFGPGEEEAAFQPFWRRPGQTTGTGLGLALVRQVAKAHGGEAGASNRAVGGARVWMRMPC